MKRLRRQLWRLWSVHLAFPQELPTFDLTCHCGNVIEVHPFLEKPASRLLVLHRDMRVIAGNGGSDDFTEVDIRGARYSRQDGSK